MVAGESGLGKTTFINTLFSTTIKNYADHRRRHAKQVDKTVEIEITKAELEEKFFKGKSAHTNIEQGAKAAFVELKANHGE
jgi:cell division control protein 12